MRNKWADRGIPDGQIIDVSSLVYIYIYISNNTLSIPRWFIAIFFNDSNCWNDKKKIENIETRWDKILARVCVYVYTLVEAGKQIR